MRADPDYIRAAAKTLRSQGWHRAAEILEAADALASQEPVAWQDMSTAPKDGSRFLAYTEDGGVDFFRWQDHGTCAPVGWRDSFILVYREGDEKGPRGWMPVPSVTSPVVPAAAKAEAELVALKEAFHALIVIVPSGETGRLAKQKALAAIEAATNLRVADPAFDDCAAPTCEGEGT